ncbi:NAD(P)-binding protein [Ophiobolus disseminans]|uniref:NAD(P)-binding protein n=1 Tax=Ophiobolus disseminans TaxID=1469910 RepID=A0A6A7A4P3_9PLEO|nr:NAD(P)-binding protein [Ophiobolus disseminans]
MAFEWLAPILTPTALRSVQADGRPVITLFLVIFGLSLFGLVCWYIHFETSKAYPKKVDPNAKKATEAHLMTSQATALTLQDKVAIVTGASRGIGAGLALELARRGAKVTLVYTSQKSSELAEKVAADIKALNNGSAATIVQADLATVDAPEKIVQATLKAFGGKIDILVNNAGVLFGRPITETTAEDYANIFDVNVRAPLLMTRAVVPHLRAPGRIINLSSVGARIGPPQMALYAGSKAAIEGMTRSLAQELGGAGHTVNAVAPGATESEMLDDVPKDMVEAQLKITAVERRVGKVDDVARIVAWLASEDAKWVSGQTISASGGFLML